MQIVAQFLAPGYAFMARGQRHTVRHAYRITGKPGIDPYVLVVGERADGGYFEAEFPWGDNVDILD